MHKGCKKEQVSQCLFFCTADFFINLQLAEVEKADIDGLERCPFCEFATIMDTTPEEDKVFRCHNPECGKDSCRICKELNHIPLRCEEIEKDGEVRKRTYIENKMTEVRSQLWVFRRHKLVTMEPFYGKSYTG